MAASLHHLLRHPQSKWRAASLRFESSGWEVARGYHRLFRLGAPDALFFSTFFVVVIFPCILFNLF